VKNKPNARKWELQGQGKKGNCNFFFSFFSLTLRAKCKLKVLDQFGQEKKHHSLKE